MGRRQITSQQRAEGQRLAASLRDARKRLPTAQTELAANSGVSIDTIRAVEGNRVASPSFFTVARLARELGVTLDGLADDVLAPAPRKD
jgi:transcriptional regulator with XRE-family HTH domain